MRKGRTLIRTEAYIHEIRPLLSQKGLLTHDTWELSLPFC
jgi:hypothetical protein